MATVSILKYSQCDTDKTQCKLYGKKSTGRRNSFPSPLIHMHISLSETRSSLVPERVYTQHTFRPTAAELTNLPLLLTNPWLLPQHLYFLSSF